MEYERILSSHKSYGTGSEASSYFTADQWGERSLSTGLTYPVSDLISSQEHFTKDEITQQVSKAKRLSAVSIIVTGVFLVMSFISSEDSDSSAAYGFAFDSLIACITSIILLWRFWSVKNLEHRNRKRELIALSIVCLSLILTGVLVGYKAIKALVCEEKHKKSTMLLVLSAVSVVIYLVLFALKYRLSRRLHSQALRVDAIDDFCGAILALSIATSTSTREFTTKAWFLDSIIALGVALFSMVYSVYAFVHLRTLYKDYRHKPLSPSEILYEPQA